MKQKEVSILDPSVCEADSHYAMQRTVKDSKFTMYDIKHRQ